MIGIYASNLDQQIKWIGNQVIHRELESHRLQQNVNILRGKKEISQEMIPEILAHQILILIKEAIAADPRVKEMQQREVMPNLEDLYDVKLFLLLQEKLGQHPFL